MAAVQGVDRESAREAAAEELARPVYRESEPTLTQRALEWLWERLADLVEAVVGAGVGARLGLLLAAVLLGVVVVVVRLRTGALARRSAVVDAVGARALSASEHRRLADRLAAEGRHADAVRERMRALVRELEERGLLVPRLGLTAGEVAAEAGALAPGIAPDLRAAAALFDEVWYGGRPATVDTVRRLADVDERVRTARLTVRPDAPVPAAVRG